MNRFDHAEQHTDEAVDRLSREVTTKLDGHANVIDTFRVEQLTMGKIQDQLRDDLEKANNANGAEINDLKRCVTKLEEEVLSKEN